MFAQLGDRAGTDVSEVVPTVLYGGFGQLPEKMKEIEGLTLADRTSIRMMGRGSESSREATEVRTGPIPASSFDVAAIAKGYKKVDSPLAELGKR